MKQLSFFATADAPYYIYGLDYSQRSAGQRALHYLCHALNELGYEAYISSEVTHPGLRTPTLTRRIRKRHAEAGCTPIVVYPEIVSGNPLDGRVVARWLLNQPGHLAGDRFYDDTDLIFVYSRAFELPGFQAQVLHIPTVDTTVFNNLDNPDDGTRDLVCYYANKYLYKGERLTRHAQDALSLGQEVKLSRAQIAAILRRCRLLYIYEPTALMNEALLCGCPVCVVDSEYWRNNTGNMRFASDIGIAMSDTPEALAEAHRSVGNYAQAYARNIDLAWTQMRRFVNLTQMRVRQLPRQAIQEFTEPDALAATDSITPSYALWMAARQDIPAQGPTQKAAQGQTWFHVVIPLIEGAESMLSGTLHALAAQSHSHWRASILSTGAAPADLANHPAVDWQRLDEVQFTTAINRLAKASTSDWLYFMEAGDTLAPHAFEALAEQAARQPHCAALYGDEDALDDQGQRDRPYFKSDYAIDFHRAAAYALNAGIAVKRTTFLELSGLDPAAEGAEYYDLILRLYESRGATAIGHLADVLYHRRSDSGHGSLSLEATLAVRESALRRHLERCAAAAEIEPGTLPGTFRIRYAVPAETRVSIIVPTRNGGAYLQRCVGAILENTRYPHWELIVVDQASDAPETQEFLQLLRASDDVRLQVLDQDGDNSLPELINAGAEQARGSYLLFLSDGAAPLQTDWLDELLGYAVQPGVGAVGAKMVGADGGLSFAGYILGLGGQPAGLHDLHEAPGDYGYFGRLQVPGNPSAVSANCLLTEKALFHALGGFDAVALATGYSDVDYCLRAAQAGRRTVWTPFALLLQEHTTAPPPQVEDEDGNVCLAEAPPSGRAILGAAECAMYDRWLHRIAFDPAYNRNLTLSGQAFEIEIAPWLLQDPAVRPLPRVLAHPGDRNGCGEYRIIAPLRALSQAGEIQGWDTMLHLSIPELERLSPDTLILQRQISWAQIEVMEDYFRYTKALRVYELDDLITNVQLNNQLRKNVDTKDLNKRLRKALSLCDRFVVATDFLAEEYRGFNSDIRVVPNYLEGARWGNLVSQRRQGRRPRVGWAGSVSHDGDLALVRDVVLATKDEIEWVFMGLCPEGVRQYVEFRASVAIEDYPARLASLNLDLAIAPLEDVPFNHAKSHLRLLEYGILGWPVICSDLTPYRGDFPVTRVKNRYKDWLNTIRGQIADMDALAAQGDALQAHIRRHWLLEDNLDRWREAWLP